MEVTASRRRLLMLMHLVVLMMMLGAKPSAALTQEQIQKLSADGEKLLDREVKRGFRGLRVLKTFADRNEEKHERLRAELDRALAHKQESARLAREAGERLETRAQSCNASLWPLWEAQCRPCLETSCKHFVSVTCGGGFGNGSFARDVDSFFQSFNPFAFILGNEAAQWLNFTDAAISSGGESLPAMEEHFHNLSKEITGLFQQSLSALGAVSPTLSEMLGQDLIRWFRTPLSRAGRAPRSLDSVDRSPFLRWPDRSPLLGLSEDPFFWSSVSSIGQGLEPLTGMRDLLGRLFGGRRVAVTGGDKDEARTVSSSSGVGFGQGGDGFRCKEIQRSSKGCLAMKDECDHCQALIRECPELEGLQRALSRALEAAEWSAERFNRTRDVTGQHLRESTLLFERMMSRFGWVSKLADRLRDPAGIFRVETVLTRDGSGVAEDGWGPTDVSVRVLDSEPLTFSLPGGLAWDDPRFLQTVVERALREYRSRVAGKNVSTK